MTTLSPAISVPLLSESESLTHARLLKALADPTRLRIINILAKREDQVCVAELVDYFVLEQPTISHHIRLLRDAGLIEYRKKGLYAYYYVRKETLDRARAILDALT